MKTRVAGVVAALFLCFGSAASGQNLLINGDFETGELSPWTVTEGQVSIISSISLVAAATSGTISQTFVTKPGSTYYVTLDASSDEQIGLVTISARPLTGGPPIGSRNIADPTPIRGDFHVLVFEASSSATVLDIDILSGIFNSDPELGLIDDVQVFELPPSRFTGTYKGTFTRSLGVPEFGVLQKVSEKLTAKVDATGRIVILRDATDVSAGYIFQDGTFALRIAGVRRTGTAKVKGKRIEFQFDATDSVSDEADGSLATESVTRFVLTRLTR